MGEARRQKRRRSQRVTTGGFVRMQDDHDGEIYRHTGQMYENTVDGKLHVTVRGKWVVCDNDKQAIRIIEKAFKLKFRGRRK